MLTYWRYVKNADYAFYAPGARTSISGLVNVYGAIIGNSVAISGGAAVHYDASLGRIGN